MLFYFKKILLFFLILNLVFSFLIVKAESNNSKIEKKDVINLVNLERAKQGKNILQESEKLNQIAQIKLEDMQKNNYFSHTSPNGKNPWDFFKEKNYDFEYAGENLALNFSSAEKQQQAWMQSASHRTNILNDKFTETGIAIGEFNYKNKKAILVVQVFASPKKASLNSSSFSPSSYQVANNFNFAGLKSNDEKKETILKDFFSKDSEKTFKLFSQSILILITFLILILEWRILVKR